ncbi:MAG TPA: hypothetical protein VGJ94_07270 [Syntrophorhabdaceae bacterium]|jgi:hypothetical protein
MGYTETPNVKLKKPTPLTPEAEWPGYINGNFDALDAELTNRHKKSEDVIPDSDNTRSIGSMIRQFFNGFFSQITLGGVTRTTWPSPGSGSQSMDDTYNNGSVVNVDNGHEIHKLSVGKKFQITDATGSTVFLEVVDGVITVAGQVKFPTNQNPSPDPNTLDDYEEGTWTAGFTAGSGTITLNSSYRTGSYTKVGNRVSISGSFLVESVSSPSGHLAITGLPFVCANSESAVSAVSIWAYGLAASTTGALMGATGKNLSTLAIHKFNAGSATALAGDVLAGTQIVVCATYMV